MKQHDEDVDPLERPTIPQDILDRTYAENPDLAVELMRDDEGRLELAQQIADESAADSEGVELTDIDEPEVSPDDPLEKLFPKVDGKYLGKYATVDEMRAVLDGGERKPSEGEPESLDDRTARLDEQEMMDVASKVSMRLLQQPDLLSSFQKKGLDFPSNEEEFAALEEVAPALYIEYKQTAERLYQTELSEAHKAKSLLSSRESLEEKIMVGSLHRLAEDTGYADEEAMASALGELLTMRGDDRYYKTVHGVRVMRENAPYDFILSQQSAAVFDAIRTNAKGETTRTIEDAYSERRRRAGDTVRTIAQAPTKRAVGVALPPPEVLYGGNATLTFSQEQLNEFRESVRLLPPQARKKYEDYIENNT